MAQQRPLEHSPWVDIDRSSQKSIHRCIMTRQNKKSFKEQQEARHFAFSGHFGHFSHFLLWRTGTRAFIRSTLNWDECHLNKMEIKTTSKIDFSSDGVTEAWPQSLITRHQNTRFCISDIHGSFDVDNAGVELFVDSSASKATTKNKGSWTSNLSQSCGSCWEGCDIWCCDMWCCDIWWWWLYWCQMLGPIVFRRICISLLGLFQGLAMLKFSPKLVLRPVIIIIIIKNIISIIIYLFFQAKEGAFWGLQHAQIVTKVCRKLGSGENWRIRE